MPYVVNGKVVEKKPFSIVEFFVNLWRLVVLFFQSIFSSNTIDRHLESYNSRRKGYGGGSTGGNVHRLAKPAMMGGCSGGG
jgi:hypothetical protein